MSLIIIIIPYSFRFADDISFEICNGEWCKRRQNGLGGNLNFFESPGYPASYGNREVVIYFLYIPNVQKICFSFDETHFRLEMFKDALDVGPSPSFYEIQQVREYFITHESVQPTTGTPDDFCINSDLVWILFSTNRNSVYNGWRLFWHVAGMNNCIMLIFIELPVEY